MQIKKVVRFIREKLTAAGKRILQVFSFHKGNVFDVILRSTILALCLLLVGGWAVNKFILTSQFPIVPPPCAVDEAILRDLVRDELQELLVAEYSWVLQPPGPVLVPDLASGQSQAGQEDDSAEDDWETAEVLATAFEQILWPLKGDIAAEYGWYRHPVYQDWRFNSGIVLAAAAGDQIRSILPGRVQDIYPADYGFEVIIEHGSGWQSVYRGAREVAVGIGDKIQQNQWIAAVGASGELFFSLKFDDEPINPLQYMAAY